MSTLSPSGLLNLESAADFQKLVQENFEIINESPVFQRKPTKRNGVPNTDYGPPTTGTWPASCYWIDQALSLWVNKAYGNPGAWIQLDAALVVIFPVNVPVGYQIVRTDMDWRRYIWNGTDWDELYLSIQGGTLEGPLILSRDPILPLEAATMQYVDARKDANYVFRQMVPSDRWPVVGDTGSSYIEHNLNKKPSVTVVDDYDQIWIGDVQYINDNQVLIVFASPVSGKAYFN